MSVLTASRRQIVTGVAALVTLAMVPVTYAKQALQRFKLKVSEIVFDGQRAIVGNRQLSAAVKSNKSKAVASLAAELGPLTADQVSLDNEGRVVIANDAAVAKMKAMTTAKPRGAADDINYNCHGCK